MATAVAPLPSQGLSTRETATVGMNHKAAGTNPTVSLMFLPQCGQTLFLPKRFNSFEKKLIDVLQWGHFIVDTFPVV